MAQKGDLEIPIKISFHILIHSITKERFNFEYSNVRYSYFGYGAYDKNNTLIYILTTRGKVRYENDNPRYKLSKEIAPENLLNNDSIFRIEAEFPTKFIHIYINVSNFFRQMISNEKIPNYSAILNHIKRECEDEVFTFPDKHDIMRDEEFVKKISMPVKYDNFNKPDHTLLGYYTKIPLFNYQLENILFMHEVEKKAYTYQFHIVPSHTKIVDIPNFPKDYLYYDTITERFNEHERPAIVLAARGGAIMDEMGLGKTATIITYIASTILEPFPIRGPECPIVEYPFKPLFYRIQEPALSYCSNQYIPSDATLIITEKHMVAQWVSEIEATLRIQPRVLVIAEAKDIITRTYREIVTAQIIVMSYSMFDNISWKTGYRMGSGKGRGLSENGYRDTSKITMEMINNSREDTIRLKPLLDDEMPNLFAFLFRRIVFDEAHMELCAKMEDAQRNHTTMLMNIHGKYSWYVSGTVPDLSHSQLVIQWLLHADESKFRELDHNKIDKNIELDYRMSSLFRRNTDLSTRMEKQLAELNNFIEYVDFTPHEMLIYSQLAKEGIDTKEVRKFCTCPFVVDLFRSCVTVDEICNVVIS